MTVDSYRNFDTVKSPELRNSLQIFWCYESGLSVTIIKSAQTTKEKLKILDEVNGMDLTPLEQVLTKKKVANSTRPEKELRGVNAPQAVLSHPRNCEVDGIYLTRLNFKKEDKCT
ncbi:hypothetical protein WUBG_17864 [Wuchereria bancrofti]|uniref:Uncharacterized protein n=1 Tax=Wuchereria bancrofti TaxID=6293 RepID=J9AB86_WUCBA|nr:hypothetical protein WUBG_17864 [Wuchereria bancrofti]